MKYEWPAEPMVLKHVYRLQKIYKYFELFTIPRYVKKIKFS